MRTPFGTPGELLTGLRVDSARLDHAVLGTASRIFDGSWHAPVFGVILDVGMRRGRGGK
jgi:hypothetical protein